MDNVKSVVEQKWIQLRSKACELINTCEFFEFYKPSTSGTDGSFLIAGVCRKVGEDCREFSYQTTKDRDEDFQRIARRVLDG